MIEVIPALLEQNFDELQKKLKLVEGISPWVHIDVMDNTLMQNVTFLGWPAFKQYHGLFSFEAHLMVANAIKYIDPLVTNGFTRLIAHVEGNDIREFIHQAKEHHVEVGVAIDAPSDIEIIEPFLEEVDCVLVMMLPAGRSGQSFDSHQLEKVRRIRESFPHLPIAVDGGIDKTVAPSVREAGATRLLSTSYLFWKNPQRIAEAIEDLRG